MTYEGARSVIGPLLQNLGASAALVGVIAGFGEMLAASLRLFSPAGRPHATPTGPSRFWDTPLTLVAVPLLAFAGTGNWRHC